MKFHDLKLMLLPPSVTEHSRITYFLLGYWYLLVLYFGIANSTLVDLDYASKRVVYGLKVTGSCIFSLGKP